ncbi:MAG: hypothetical protein PHW02_00945 [bacterium]|nr:hypothetical protein [bacterium]
MALNFLYGYIVYSRAKLIQARRFNTSMLLFIMNGFVFSISILSMLHVNGLEYMSGVVFIQQNGLNSWNVIRNPAIFSLSFLSLFAFAGFPPFGGISEQNDANLAYEKNNTRSILWILARIFRYSLYAFFINLYFGGASSILFMLLKLLAIHTLFSLVSTIFPKMGTKENTLFNSLMLILLAVVVVLQGGKFN